MSTSYEILQESKNAVSTMKALVFRGPNRIGIEEVPIPRPASGEVVIRITLSTIRGTDLHILKGEYPVKPGLIIGHEPVGVIHEIGPGVTGYRVGDRVLSTRRWNALGLHSRTRITLLVSSCCP